MPAVDMEALRKDTLEAIKANEEERYRLGQVLAVLTNEPGKVLQVPTSFEYLSLGVTAAAQRYLSETPTASTREIADVLLARGVKTKSGDFLNTVYASLANAKELFVRVGKVWRLRTPEDDVIPEPEAKPIVKAKKKGKK